MSIMDAMRDYLTPQRREGLAALGVGLGQMSAGQPVNLQPQYQAMIQRQQREQQAQMLQESGLLERFTPEQRSILAMMEPEAAQRVIASAMFSTPDPVKPVEVNGQLVNPQTGEVIGDYRNAPDPGFRLLTPEEVAANRLDPARAYQVGGDGRISQIGSGGVTVNNNMGADGVDYGSPGPGLVWQRDAAGNIVLDDRGAPVAIPFQGGPVYRAIQEAEAEAEAAAIQGQNRDELAERSGSVVVEDIGRLREKVKGDTWWNPSTGLLSGIAEGIRGSNAADAKALATTIRGNIGFDRLQQMREASPTGGALGQVAVQELENLQAVLGSVELSQSEPQLLENLDRLERIYTDIMRKFAAYPNASEFGFGAQQADLPPAPNGIDPDRWPDIFNAMPPEDQELFR